MYYYFTETKWYGPITFGYIVDWSSLPSGDSLIPEFAGMVKEENKDFKFEYLCNGSYVIGEVQTAVLVVEHCTKDPNTCKVSFCGWPHKCDAEEFDFIEERRKRIRQKTVNKVHKMMDKLDEENSTENRYQKEYTESVEWVVALLDALGDLVEAKRIKEDSGETAEYLMLKDAAWYKAKTVIGAITASKYFHNDFVYAMWKTYQIPNSKFGEDGRIEENNYLKITGPYLQVLPYVRALLSEDKTMWEKIKNLFKK